MSRAATWGVVLVIAAIGVGGAVFLLKEDANVPVAFAVDASVDASTSAVKPKATKKKPGRGGKTRVAGGGGAGGGAHHGGGHGGAGRALAPAGPSYEAAIGSNNEQLTIGTKDGTDLTDSQLSAPMSDGAFVSDCGAPDDMSVTVKVAIKMGHAVGVSVYTDPASAEVAGCIDRHVRRLSWPAHPKMDSFATTY